MKGHLSEQDSRQMLLRIMMMTGNIIMISFILFKSMTFLIPKGSLMNRVKGFSMEPTLVNEQIVYTDKTDEFVRGDIVTLIYLDPVSMTESIFIKRIIGLPGEHLEIKKEGIYIDSICYHEPYLAKDQWQGTFQEGHWNEIILGMNEYYVLGDNRENSFDSRMFGPVLEEKIYYKQSEHFTIDFYITCSMVLFIVVGCIILCLVLDVIGGKIIDRYLAEQEQQEKCHGE